jgi:deazaflavin-dependent oxidoreductase (nitroreductase family)
MAAVRRTSTLKLFWKMHKWILHLSNGRLLSNVNGFPLLILHTIGRKTGQPRTNVLNYVSQGSSYVVAASNAGVDYHPAWYINLQAQSRTWIDVHGKRVNVQMREANETEAHQLYEKFVQIDSSYAEYRSRTKRKIPVVILDPIT